MANQINKHEESAISVVDYGADAGRGFEAQDPGDFSGPQLKLLQSTSPATKEGEEEHIEGAKAGMLHLTEPEEIMESVTVVPCHAMRVWSEVNEDERVVERIAKSTVPAGAKFDRGYFLEGSGHGLLEERIIFALVMRGHDVPAPVQIIFRRTQCKKAVAWVKSMERKKAATPDGQSIVRPMFSHVWKLESETERGKGNSWFGWKITDAEQDFIPGDALYDAGRALANDALAIQRALEKPCFTSQVPQPEAQPLHALPSPPHEDDIPF